MSKKEKNTMTDIINNSIESLNKFYEFELYDIIEQVKSQIKSTVESLTDKDEESKEIIYNRSLNSLIGLTEHRKIIYNSLLELAKTIFIYNDTKSENINEEFHSILKTLLYEFECISNYIPISEVKNAEENWLKYDEDVDAQKNLKNTQLNLLKPIFSDIEIKSYHKKDFNIVNTSAGFINMRNMGKKEFQEKMGLLSKATDNKIKENLIKELKDILIINKFPVEY